MEMKLSGHDAEGMKSSAGRATPHEGRDHSDLEAEDRNRCPERQYETPNVAAGKDRRVEAEAESANMGGGSKHRVNGKPDGKVEYDANDSRRLSDTHLFSSIRIRCITAICPAGPPKLSAATRSQTRKASPIETP